MSQPKAAEACPHESENLQEEVEIYPCQGTLVPVIPVPENNWHLKLEAKDIYNGDFQSGKLTIPWKLDTSDPRFFVNEGRVSFITADKLQMRCSLSLVVELHRMYNHGQYTASHAGIKLELTPTSSSGPPSALSPLEIYSLDANGQHQIKTIKFDVAYRYHAPPEVTTHHLMVCFMVHLDPRRRDLNEIFAWLPLSFGVTLEKISLEKARYTLKSATMELERING